MKQTILILCLLGSVFLLFLPAGADVTMPRSVIGCGAADLGDGSRSVVIGTLGQPVVGVMSGAVHDHELGFWYQYREVATGLGGTDGRLPAVFSFGPNYPNPFNPVTTFEFAVPRPSRVTIKLYDISGREVKTLVDEWTTPGYHKTVLDAAGLASGVYLSRMAADRFVETRKLVLLR